MNVGPLPPFSESGFCLFFRVLPFPLLILIFRGMLMGWQDRGTGQSGGAGHGGAGHRPRAPSPWFIPFLLSLCSPSFWGEMSDAFSFNNNPAIPSFEGHLRINYY